MSPSLIVVASANVELRSAVRAALCSAPDMSLIGEASNQAELLAFRRSRPKVLLLDSTFDAVASNLWPDMRVIVFAAVIDDHHVIQALRLGARAVVPRMAPSAVLVECIRAVLANRYWLGSESIEVLVRTMRSLLDQPAENSPQPHRLTAREHSIVAMIAGGYSNKQIGQLLSISERTVKHHLTNIFGKLGVSSRLQLATFAVAQRLNAHPENAGSAGDSGVDRGSADAGTAITVLGS